MRLRCESSDKKNIVRSSTAADGGGMLGIETGVAGRSIQTFKLNESEPIEFT